MKEQKYFLASTNNDIEKAFENSQLYKNPSYCLLQKAKELMTQCEIKPTTGILTSVSTDDDCFTIIERYDNQFRKIEVPMNLFTILSSKNEPKMVALNKNVNYFEKKEISNLYNYLNNQDNFELLQNDFCDKSWYNIPIDNSDILQQSFFRISNIEDNKNQKKQLEELKKLFPKQSYIIGTISKLMKRMDKEEFQLFIGDIYDKREQSFNYENIKNTAKNYTMIEKTKKLLKSNK